MAGSRTTTPTATGEQSRDFEQLAGYLRSLKSPVLIGFEATGNYHRPLAYFLHRQGFELRLILGIDCGRYSKLRIRTGL